MMMSSVQSYSLCYNTSRRGESVWTFTRFAGRGAFVGALGAVSVLLKALLLELRGGVGGQDGGVRGEQHGVEKEEAVWSSNWKLTLAGSTACEECKKKLRHSVQNA